MSKLLNQLRILELFGLVGSSFNMAQGIKMSEQEEFVKGLLEVYGKQPLPFGDFTIDCEDGQVEAHRLILALRSKYFDALFRLEGNKVRSLSLPQFSHDIMSAIVKSLIVADVEAIEQAGCKDVLQAADYFQIKHLAHDVSMILQERITEENFIEYAQLADMFNADTLADICATVGQRKLTTYQKHMVRGSFHALSKPLLFKLFKPKLGMIDQRQRPMDMLETQLHLLNMIDSILKDAGKLDDLLELLECNYFGVPELLLCLNDAIEHPSQFDGIPFDSYKCVIPDPKRREELHNDLLMVDEKKAKEPESALKPWKVGTFRFHKMKYFLPTGPFGSGNSTHVGFWPYDGHVKWEIIGDIRAIGIKSRIWGTITIIQGFKVELSDGTQKAVGMELNDIVNVASFSVDPDDHIVRPFTLRSGWYIDKIGFRTKKGQLLGPIGGEGGEDRSNVDAKNLPENSYLWGIEGYTRMDEGAPCIFGVRFNYFAVRHFRSQG